MSEIIDVNCNDCPKIEMPIDKDILEKYYCTRKWVSKEEAKKMFPDNEEEYNYYLAGNLPLNDTGKDDN